MPVSSPDDGSTGSSALVAQAIAIKVALSGKVDEVNPGRPSGGTPEPSPENI